MPGALVAALLLCKLADPRISESSGLVASVTSPGLMFTHNDSGDIARFFEIDRTCRTRATFVLPGVQARDWEDISRGSDSTLWLGDIGDNSGIRARGILVHRVPEPGPATGTVELRATSYRLRYEDGPHDAEALVVHPRTGQLLVVTKSFAGGRVYAAPLPLRAGVANVLRHVADVPIPEVTAGDISPDGTRLVLRNYTAAYQWEVPGDDVVAALRKAPTRIPLPPSPQGEAISYEADNHTLLVTSEGVGAAVDEVRPEASPSAAPPARATPTAPAGGGRGPWPAVVAGAALLLVAGLIGLRRTRHGSAR